MFSKLLSLPLSCPSLVPQRSWIIKLMEWKSTLPPRPKVDCCLSFYKLVNHFVFEWTLFGVIIVNIILTIVELTVNNTMVLLVLQYLNYIFCLVYIVEAVLKVIGLRQHYFLSKWNIFDFLVLLVALVDIVVEVSVPEDSTTRFSPSVLRVVGVLKVLRVGRVLRLIKVRNSTTYCLLSFTLFYHLNLCILLSPVPSLSFTNIFNFPYPSSS